MDVTGNHRVSDSEIDMVSNELEVTNYITKHQEDYNDSNIEDKEMDVTKLPGDQRANKEDRGTNKMPIRQYLNIY